MAKKQSIMDKVIKTAKQFYEVGKISPDIRKCVELGLGVCFAPAFSWYGLFSDNVALKKLEGYRRNTYVFTDPSKHISLCAKRFFDMLVEPSRGVN